MDEGEENEGDDLDKHQDHLDGGHTHDDGLQEHEAVDAHYDTQVAEGQLDSEALDIQQGHAVNTGQYDDGHEIGQADPAATEGQHEHMIDAGQGVDGRDLDVGQHHDPLHFFHSLGLQNIEEANNSIEGYIQKEKHDVINDQLSSNDVISDQLSNNAVISDQLSNNDVISDQLSNNAVISDQLSNNDVINDQLSNNAAIASDDVTLDFFHSLGLQTLQEANKRPDFRKNLEETQAQGISDVVLPGKNLYGGHPEASSTVGGIEDNLWGSVNTDISFVESLGLYWPNPGTDGKLSQGHDKDAEANGDGVKDDKNDEGHDKGVSMDLEDCLGLLDFTSKSEISGKRWRLWNPVLEDTGGFSGGQDDTWQSEQVTDPTLVEIHAHKLAVGQPPQLDTSPPSNQDLSIKFKSPLSDEAAAKFKNKNASALFYCSDCNRSISSKDLLARHLKSELHAKNSSNSSSQVHRKKSTKSSQHQSLENAGKRKDFDLHYDSTGLESQGRKKKQKMSILFSDKESEPEKGDENVQPNSENIQNSPKNLQTSPQKQLLTRTVSSSCLPTADQLLNSIPVSSVNRNDTDKKDDHWHVGDERDEVEVQRQEESGRAHDDAETRGPDTSMQLRGCSSCGAAVQVHQLGKHLVSHFHYHRSLGHAEEHSLILDNIETIIHQSPYQCQPCQFYCNWHRDLKEHVRSHNIAGIFWCLICDKIMNSNEELITHLESEDHRDLISVINRSIPAVIQRVELVSCQVCDAKFRLNLGLKKHMVHAHGVSDFKLAEHEKFNCQFCQFSSYKRKAVETHQFLVHKDKRLQYMCKVCHLDFPSSQQIKTHRNSLEHKEAIERLKSPDVKKMCEICWKYSATGVSDLKKHLEVDHLGVLPQCNICGHLFYFSQQLKGHIKSKCRTVSGLPVPEGGKYSCHSESCTFSTDSEWRLLRHRRIKHREKPAREANLKCTKCYRKFLCAEQLQNHNDKYHKENQMFKCVEEGCKYESYSDKLYKLHLKRSHSAPRQIVFKCDDCDKQYGSKSALHNHVQSFHSGEKSANFVCETEGCEAKFMFKSDLDRHKLKHGQEKKFACQTCSFTTKRKSDLTRHIRLQHEQDAVVSLKCDHCPYQTKISSHLKRHQAAKHASDSQEIIFTNVDPDELLFVCIDNEIGRVDEIDIQ